MRSIKVWAAIRSSESEDRTTDLMDLRRRGSTSDAVEFVALSISEIATTLGPLPLPSSIVHDLSIFTSVLKVNWIGFVLSVASSLVHFGLGWPMNQSGPQFETSGPHADPLCSPNKVKPKSINKLQSISLPKGLDNCFIIQRPINCLYVSCSLVNVMGLGEDLGFGILMEFS